MAVAVVPDLAAAYDRYFGSGLYGARYPRPNPAMARVIGDALPLAAPGAVLDFGCGNGRYLPLLLARPGLTVTGYDISRAAIATCQHQFRAATASGQLRLVCGELAHLQGAVGPASQDTILLMFGVLGHIRGRANRIATLRTLRGLLRPGGRLVATVPSRHRRFRAEQQRCAALVQQGTLEPGDILYRRDAEAGSVELYYHLFTATEFGDEIAAAGFARPRLVAESVLPERGATAAAGGGALDALLRLVCPVSLAYGFAASVERPADA